MIKGCKNFDNIMNYNKQAVDIMSTSEILSRRFQSHLNLPYLICKHVCEQGELHSAVSKCIPLILHRYIFNMVYDINVSKKEIYQCKISEVTISKCYKELLKYHKHLFPNEILEKIY